MTITSKDATEVLSRFFAPGVEHHGTTIISSDHVEIPIKAATSPRPESAPDPLCCLLVAAYSASVESDVCCDGRADNF